MIGSSALQGKTVIDACNPIGGGPPVNGVLSFFTPQNQSLMEQLQKAYPSAHFVKAFNSVGNGQMINPDFAGGRPTMFICGNDENAKKTSSRQFLDQFGWDTEDMGAVEAARPIEALCMLWCIPGIGKERLVAARFQAPAMIPRALVGIPNRAPLPYMRTCRLTRPPTSRGLLQRNRRRGP